ncbi:O-methylsterigmatocystin oxidoreductase [Naviculisporaceae sp. PSN 640]
MISTLSFFAAVLLLLLLLQVRKFGSRPKGYPPGPPTWPIVGNLLQIPRVRNHLKFQEWAEKYGPIYSVIAGSRVMVFLNEPQVVKDLFDKRGAIYGSRPDLYLSRLSSDRMVRLPYSDTWRLARRQAHNLLTLKSARLYDPYQDVESKAMLAGIIDKPDILFQHIRRFTTSIATQMILGARTPQLDDPMILTLHANLQKWTTLSHDSSILDMMPVLRLLPERWIPFYTDAIEADRHNTEFFTSLWMDVKASVAAGTAKDSFAADLVKVQQTSTPTFTDKFAAYLCGTLLEAGSETTHNTLMGFIQAMLLFPDIQSQAQKILNTVCGERMPTLDDMDNPDMQYIRACVKESLRWMPTGIMGFPHATTHDDEYRGYKIPKGAMVLCNTWTIHQNPERYPNPREFDPMRYISDMTSSTESAISEDVSQRDHFGFGSGRRICPGMHLVDRTMFITIARLLWAFEFRCPLDEHGQEILPDPEDLVRGLVARPREFGVKVVVRQGLGREEVIRRAWGECEKELHA